MTQSKELATLSGKTSTPHYYLADGEDIFDIAHKWGLDMEKATAVKYIKRAGHKVTLDIDTEIEDMRKAIVCLEREIDHLKELRATQKLGGTQ